MGAVDIGMLRQRQAMSLDEKINFTRKVIVDWYEYWGGNVYVSFSGGKDSTVLLYQIRAIYPLVPAVFVDTGLEYPEIREFVRTIENVTWVRPKMLFHKVIEKYGYPIVSKETATKIHEIKTTNSDYLLNKRLHGDANGNGKLGEKWKYLLDAPFKISDYCCDVIKKRPIHSYENLNNRKSYVGILAADSNQRRVSYCRNGCNIFNSTHPVSHPLAIWMEKDIWDYITTYSVPYSKIYDMGYTRTGCMFCMFGVHLEQHPNRFELMKETHPAQYNYCINKLGCGKVMDFIGVTY
jgi:3'-phosphoadenosine 5'-phosphosulfate sulfotransferase (PAPS reductase)/FAD synthetase